MTDPVLIELPATVHTDRLVLRPPQANDGAALHDAIVESLSDLRRFLVSLPWVAGEQTVESSEVFCRNGQANFIARKDLPFLMFSKSTGQLIGATGLHRINWGTVKAEVGYWVRSSQFRNGYISEAVRALTEYAFIQLSASRVEIITDTENLASRKVAESCRFALEGVLQNDRRAPDGSLRSTCIYARFPPAA